MYRCSKPRCLCRRDAIGQTGAAGLCAPRGARARRISGSQLAWRVQVPIAAAPTCTRAELSTDCRAAATRVVVVVSSVAKASRMPARTVRCSSYADLDTYIRSYTACDWHRQTGNKRTNTVCSSNVWRLYDRWVDGLKRTPGERTKFRNPNACTPRGSAIPRRQQKHLYGAAAQQVACMDPQQGQIA